MKLKTFFTRWLQKIAVVAFLASFGNEVQAQANYWAVFGTNGCSSF